MIFFAVSFIYVPFTSDELVLLDDAASSKYNVNLVLNNISPKICYSVILSLSPSPRLTYTIISASVQSL